jgi:adenylyltransferase/sulfurtransferase
LYGDAPTGHIPNCAEAGIIGAMAGMVGSVQALEAVKLALGLDWCQRKGLVPLLDKVWTVDAKTMMVRVFGISRQQDCRICSAAAHQITLQPGHVAALRAPEATALRKKAIFIDVREPHELATGKIPNALHIPLGRLLLDTVPIYDLPTHALIIVYCQHGIRSLTGAAHLITLGYRNVYHLQGGIAQWTEELDSRKI